MDKNQLTPVQGIKLLKKNSRIQHFEELFQIAIIFLILYINLTLEEHEIS